MVPILLMEMGLEIDYNSIKEEGDLLQQWMIISVQKN